MAAWAVCDALLPLPALASHVALIVLGCAQEQMIDIHACPVVTGVADEQALWEGAMHQLVRHAVLPDALLQLAQLI